MIRLINRLLSAKGLKRLTRFWAYPLLKKHIDRDLSFIGNSAPANHIEGNEIIYIRSDFWLRGTSPNGAVAHTEGVTNALFAEGFQLDVFSTYPIPFVKNYRSFSCIIPDGLFTGISEIEEMEYNTQLYKALSGYRGTPKFIYQRYSRNNYAGLMFAKSRGIPFVLEYNGSEIWMSKNWGKPLKYEKISAKIEEVVLRNADIIVGNAEAFRKELIDKGVNPERIAIIPNGVDPNRFSPEINGDGIREFLDVEKKDILATFIGSYGPWHGTEVFASSIQYVIRQNRNVKFLFIGEGKGLVKVKEIVRNDNVEEFVLFAGMVERDRVPQYLAASDILVSPQVPNPDGSPFFGSPTKLFEYMAMGKAIVASDLDQIGAILSSGVDAVLFKPGDFRELADKILMLVGNPSLRQQLGINARNKVVKSYTWERHVQLILDKVDSI